MRPIRIPALSASSAGTVLVAVAIGVAFADSSIVVLALPQLLGEFDASITGVSWVITAYNLVVAVVALALGRRLARSATRRVALGGLAVFLAGSLACALAGSLEVLVALRCVQGVGAALLLTASLPILVALTGSEQRGTGVWIAAGALGAAIGPALGGLLTEAFDWRAIFVVQAPLAALAPPGGLGAAPPRAEPSSERAG